MSGSRTRHASAIFTPPSLRKQQYDVDPGADVLRAAIGAVGPVAQARAQLGRTAQAEAALRELDAKRPVGWDVHVVAQNYYRMCALPEDGERWLDGFRKAGLDL